MGAGWTSVLRSVECRGELEGVDNSEVIVHDRPAPWRRSDQKHEQLLPKGRVITLTQALQYVDGDN